MNQQTCNPAQLDALLKNDLSESAEQLLMLHLDECSECREELESRAADQSAWQEAFSLLGGVVLPSTAVIGEHRTETIRSPQIEQVLNQLAPTDDPESLGRIGGYEVIGVVGAGGMGVVLKAHDRSLDRIVAIKVMSPHLASSGSARKRFAREAKAAAAVLHPNVIAIHGVASDEACPYLVMPYVRGASLQKRIDSQGPLPLKDTLRIGAQIAAGLAAAHEQGLVHRDIKPANILLEEGVERVTITDFGLARAVDDASMTCSGVIAGTPQYMSPEQTRGEPIDARSDLFSLGSVLYAMCAGRSPFRAETTYGVLHRIANDIPTPICEVNSDVPVWLSHIIERLLAKRPDDRFDSASQVAELLEGCLAHVQQPAAMPLPARVEQLSQLLPAALPVPPLPKKQLRQLFYTRPPLGKFIAAAVFAFSLIFAGVLIVLELDKGTLTIESELDDVPIRIIQGENVVKSLTVSREGTTTRIGAGKYVVEIGQEFDKAVVDDGGVVLSRGGTKIVKVTRNNADTAAIEAAKDEAAKAWLRRPVIGSKHDGQRFQLGGHDALMHCVMTNNSESLNRLLAMDKYDLEFVPIREQWTLLQIALQHNCIETTSMLLRYGANPNVAGKGTPLPIELAKRSGRPELVALVQEYLETDAAHPQTKVEHAKDVAALPPTEFDKVETKATATNMTDQSASDPAHTIFGFVMEFRSGTPDVPVCLCDAATGLPVAKDTYKPIVWSQGPAGNPAREMAIVVSDEKGNFRFENVPDGKYRVIAQKWIGPYKGVFELHGAEIRLMGAIDEITVPRPADEQAARVVPIPLGENTIHFNQDVGNNETFLFLSTAPPEFDPILGLQGLGTSFWKNLIGVNRMPLGKTTVIGTPNKPVYAFMFAPDNSPGYATITIPPPESGSVRLSAEPFVAGWSNGRKTPPPKLAKLIEFMKKHELTTQRLLEIPEMSNVNFKAYQARMQELSSDLSRIIELPESESVRIGDLLAAEAYRQLAR